MLFHATLGFPAQLSDDIALYWLILEGTYCLYTRDHPVGVHALCRGALTAVGILVTGILLSDSAGGAHPWRLPRGHDHHLHSWPPVRPDRLCSLLLRGR
mmetsp:Transcript_29776/g.60038  ORF Transcript_29776/g.60038 Transcript_29776/m.60038 type:complete len:99 (+) Transcript_29776:361-657(+)